MRNKTATAPTRDLLPQAEVYTRIADQTTILEAVRQVANNTKIALVIIQLSYEGEEKRGQARASLSKRAEQSTAYLLQNIRSLVRKTDLVFLHQHSLFFGLLAADLQGGSIVEERLWEALLWRVHNMDEQDILRPSEMTIGHSAYPIPCSDLDGLFNKASQTSKCFGEQSEQALPHFSECAAYGNEPELSEEKETLAQLARKLGIPYLSPLPLKPPQSVLQAVNARLAQELRCYPVGRDRNILTVAMLNPQDRSALERLHQETGLRIFPVLTHPEALERALEQLN